MKEPKPSNNGNCPKCSGDDWKLAKMLILTNVTHVDTESRGGGFGGGIGSNGIDVRYQGLDLNTTGTHTEAIAMEYAAPVPPSQYGKKGFWNNELRRILTLAAETIKSIDEFAKSYDELRPGIFSESNESKYKSLRDRYIEAYNYVSSFKSYDHEKDLWNKTRVCMRCGESFVTASDWHLVNYEPPPYIFVGEEHCCPTCHSYQWKSATSYFHIRLRELQSKYHSAKSTFVQAVDAANKPRNGFWDKVKKFVTIKPEYAQKEIERVESQLADMRQREQEAMEQYPYPKYQKIRVCTHCERLYMLYE